MTKSAVERKGTVLNICDMKVIKEEMKEANYSPILREITNMPIGRTIEIIISGKYLTGEYKVRYYKKINENQVEVIGTELKG